MIVAGGPDRRPARVAVAGLGAIGLAIATAIDRGIPGYHLAAVSARDLAGAAARVRGLARPVLVVPVAELEPLADIVIECAPAAMMRPIVEPFLRAGKTAVVLSAGALLAHDDLVEAARRHDGHIVIPTGALIGLDAVAAAAEGRIDAVRMVTRKPVRGLIGAPYLVERGIDIAGIAAPLKVFDGTAREAAAGFPANLNVAVALSLAGIGPDRTMLEIWADPALERNVHRIEVEADSARFTMTIENIPGENPRTGRITALSVIAWLRKQTAALRVGT
jgi:aspartate dehydrogenase